eukprot:TRINITY_DN1005_c0_g1_i4.p1 TRINITY_DN1005_c0_g1~~TRINITY_DN1005_c0_g1_i4.p1  ORF type:complete len:214 (+),score=36.33 TRINITY_DN1005_c0_g1_i4:93-734(+)
MNPLLLIISLTLLLVLTNAGEVRVAHASPDAPAVDVWINGLKVIDNLSFKQVSFYAPVEFGPANFIVVPTGKTSPVVINATAQIGFFTPYTVAAINLLATIQPLILVDDQRFPEFGKATVRFVHLSPNAPAVDVAVSGGPVLFSNIAYKGFTPYTSVTPGFYNLEVRPAGSTTVVLKVPNVELAPNRAYSIFAEGLLSGTGTEALAAVLHGDL